MRRRKQRVCVTGREKQQQPSKRFKIIKFHKDKQDFPLGPDSAPPRSRGPPLKQPGGRWGAGIPHPHTSWARDTSSAATGRPPPPLHSKMLPSSVSQTGTKQTCSCAVKMEVCEPEEGSNASAPSASADRLLKSATSTKSSMKTEATTQNASWMFPYQRTPRQNGNPCIHETRVVNNAIM